MPRAYNRRTRCAAFPLLLFPCVTFAGAGCRDLFPHCRARPPQRLLRTSGVPSIRPIAFRLETDMLKLYYHPSPNPAKVALYLEEARIPYEFMPVDTRKGEQLSPEFLAINPNGKTPAIDDEGVKVFDSTAILMYLGEKYGKFMPGAEQEGEYLSWMLFIASGIGPYSGQAVHFKNYAAEKIDYAIRRYQFEAERHWGIINDRLAKQKYMMGDTYGIVDMNLWGWMRAAAYVLGEEAWGRMPNVKRLFDEINARPAAAAVNALKDKHAYKMEVDQAARDVMFRHIKAA
jgi:GST-like protein